MFGTTESSGRPLIDVVVIGGGIAGMSVALECAHIGLNVELWEASERLGGSIRSVEWGSERHIEIGAVTFSHDGPVANRAREWNIPLTESIPTPTELITSIGRTTLPQGFASGAISSPLDGAFHGIGVSSFRLYADRVMPILKLGKEQSWARLIEQRFGSKYFAHVAQPFSRAAWGVDMETVEADRAVPGVNAALTRQGSLSGAISSLETERTPRLRFADTSDRFIKAFENSLLHFGVVIKRSTSARGIERDGDSLRVATSEGVVLCRAVIVATHPEALGLELPPSQTPLERPTIVVTAVYDEDASDEVPECGALVNRSDTPVRSVSLSRSEPGLGKRLLARVSLVPSSLDPAKEAISFLETTWPTLSECAPMSVDVRDWELARPRVCLGDPDPTLPWGVDGEPHIECAGQWISGPGLDVSVRHAQQVAQRVRRLLLVEKQSNT